MAAALFRAVAALGPPNAAFVSPFQTVRRRDDNATETMSDGPAPTSDTPEPTSDAPEPTSDAPEPTSDAPEPTSDAPEPTSVAPEPTSDGAEPTSDDTEPTSDGAEPTSDGTEPASDATETIGNSTPTATEATETIGNTTPAASDATVTRGNSTPTASDATETRGNSTPAVGGATETRGNSAPTASDATETIGDSTPAASDATEPMTDATETIGDSTPAASDATEPITDATETIGDSTPTASDDTITASDSTPTASGRTITASGSTLTTKAPAPPECSSFNGFETCSSEGDYASCLAGSDASFCGCNNGMQYLDCVSAAIATSSCEGAVGIDDWDAYERSWFHTSCPTPASSIMVELPQPTSVEVDLAPVSTVTPTGPISQPPAPVPAPTYREDSDMPLLEGDCGTPSYTLLDAGDMVLYAAFVGCNIERPQCCPWNVSTEQLPQGQGQRVAAAAGQFPIPASNAKADLPKCPQDYYSVSGQCCPNGYYKFTRPIAYQTPCFSSLAAVAASTTTGPPPITAGLAANPTDSSLPTSAVLNLAWAMAFNTTDEPPQTSSSGLSKGAVIGIGVGAGVAGVALLGAIGFWVMRSRKGKKGTKTAGLVGFDDPVPGQGMTYQEGYHAPGVGAPESGYGYQGFHGDGYGGYYRG